jgi:6-bladed beta-propeller
MKKLNELACTALLALVSCLPTFAQKIIPFAKGVEIKKEIKISEVASGLKYIPLETTDESLLDKDILDITFAGGYLFVCDYKKVLQFTPEGKFIRKIGKVGQGPGEYNQSILAIAYDEAQKQLFLSDMRQGKVLVYSFEGKFLQEIKTHQGEITPYIDASGNLYTLSTEYLHSKDRTGKDLLVYNKKGKLLYGFPFRFETGVCYPRLVFSPALVYSYKGEVYYKNPLETIIFRLDGKKLMPVWQLDLSQYGKLTVEEEQLKLDSKNKVGSVVSTDKKFYFFALMETDKYIGAYYSQEDERRFSWYDKQAGTVCRVRSSKVDWDGFTDDMEGGLPFCPRQFCKNQMIGYLKPADLLEKAKPATAKGSLKWALADMQEDDNQVVCVATLK